MERLIEALDYHLVYCEQVTLAVEFKDGSTASRRTHLPSATADYGLLASAALWMWRQCWHGQTLAYMHVIAERLMSRRCFQRGLFDQPTEQEERLAAAKRLINERLGRFILRSGATLSLADIYRDEANSYDICDVYGKACF